MYCDYYKGRLRTTMIAEDHRSSVIALGVG